jgi:hypothetical protein
MEHCRQTALLNSKTGFLFNNRITMNTHEALKKYRELLGTLKFSEMEPGMFSDAIPTMMFTRGGITLLLRGADAEEYTACVHELHRAFKGKDVLSEAAVSDFAADALVEVFAAGNDRLEVTDRAIQGLKSRLAASPYVWEVHLPVEGLAPSGLPIEVGNTSFYVADESIRQQLIEIAKKSIMARTESEAEGTARIDLFSRELQTHFSERTIASTRVISIDQGAARSKARMNLRRVLDCINFFADRGRLGMWLALPGEVEQRTGLELGFVKDLVPPAVMMNKVRIGPSRRLPLRQLSTRKGFGRMSSLIAKEKLSSLEDRVLNAMQWAGRARVDPRREEAFLFYAIALETLLLGKQDVELSYRLCLRGVHLVAGADLESRMLAEKQLRRLYGLRSKIVHSGNFEVSEADLELISEYARIAILVILDREPFTLMSQEGELEDWFHTQLLGKPPSEIRSDVQNDV